MARFLINHVNRLAKTPVGGSNPTRIMGILNTSPESFYKKSVRLSDSDIRDAAVRMEHDGADFIDVGGMSTAPYLSTQVSEKTESGRVLRAIRAIQSVSDLPISVDTCRASVARAALENGAEILNDVSGLKFDKGMRGVVSLFRPSVVLCAYGTAGTAAGDPVKSARDLLKQSIAIARSCGVPSSEIVLDPAIGFFRKSGKGRLFTKAGPGWADRDVRVLCSLRSIKQRHPLLVSVSNKSFLGEILGRESPEDRLFGSVAAEAISVLNGADIIRTHNVAQTRDAVSVASRLSSSSSSSSSSSRSSGRKGL